MKYIPVIQVVISTILIVLVLLQQRGSGGLGSAFGEDATSIYRTRRGLERGVFFATIILGIIFLVLAFLSIKFS